MAYAPTRGEDRCQSPFEMGDEMTDAATAIALHRKVQSANAEWLTAAVFRKHTGRKGAVASHLAFIVQSQELEYVSATISDREDAEAVVRVIAFTADKVIVIDASEATTTTVVPRMALVGLTLHDTPRLLENEVTVSGDLRIGLDYGPVLSSGPAVTLGHKDQTSGNAAELAAFLPALLTDLQQEV